MVVTSLSWGRAQGTSGYPTAWITAPSPAEKKTPGSTWLGKSTPINLSLLPPVLYPLWSSWELPEIFAPWKIGDLVASPIEQLLQETPGISPHRTPVTHPPHTPRRAHPRHFPTWDAQSQRCRGKRARSEPGTDGQAGKSGLFLLLLPLTAHFLRLLPNYFPGRLCPAVPFCSGMEGSLRIRAASNSAEFQGKARQG